MEPVFVTYASDGVTITGVFANLPSFPTTQLAGDDPTVVAFLTPNPVPQSVSPRQARLALNQQGLLDQVNAAVTAAGGATLITWEYATQINRSDPMIAALSTQLNLTSAQLDQLFQLAATL